MVRASVGGGIGGRGMKWINRSEMEDPSNKLCLDCSLGLQLKHARGQDDSRMPSGRL